MKTFLNFYSEYNNNLIYLFEIYYKGSYLKTLHVFEKINFFIFFHLIIIILLY
jgi:hypothetical protein